MHSKYLIAGSRECCVGKNCEIHLKTNENSLRKAKLRHLKKSDDHESEKQRPVHVEACPSRPLRRKARVGVELGKLLCNDAHRSDVDEQACSDGAACGVMILGILRDCLGNARHEQWLRAGLTVAAML